VHAPEMKVHLNANLLNPLTINNHSLRDSFDAASRIHSIPPHLLNAGYKFVSFDVKSLFTNVPLSITLNIILDRVFKENMISTKLSKRSLKKLILDTCKQTLFSLNGQLYQQIEGVSMGSSLGPVLANVIMTEMEKIIVDPLIADGSIPFYTRFVDDTLLLAKPEDVNRILGLFNSFHPKIQFTCDEFLDGNVHFLDLRISDNLQTDIYRKNSFTGQYVRFDSFEPWSYKIGWARSLYSRSSKLCSTVKAFNQQVSYVKQLLSWNGFPRYVRTSLCNRFKSSLETIRVDERLQDTSIISIWFKVPYLGKEGENLVRKCIQRLKHSFKTEVRFKVSYDTKKLAMFCSNKDKIPVGLKSNCIYQFKCPGCSESYIGKTDRNFDTRVAEHGSHRKDQDTIVYKHLSNCTSFHEIIQMLNLPMTNNSSFAPKAVIQPYILNAAIKNIECLSTNNNWTQLCFLEALYIKIRKPSLNTGLRATKDLVLFK